jgi:hypothetical protein
LIGALGAAWKGLDFRAEVRVAEMAMRSYNETGSVNHSTGDLPL